MMAWWKQEPALIIAVIVAVLNLAIGFGLRLTASQVSLIATLLTAVGAVITRANVHSPATVAQQVKDIQTAQAGV